MLRPQSSHLHVIDRPPTILANLADSGTEPSEKDFGFWQHILYLWSCQRNYHQQIVGKWLTSRISYWNMQADVPLADRSKIHFDTRDLPPQAWRAYWAEGVAE
jgi:hypothetical protein